ncbi:MAG: AMP-binding protein [Methanobacteriaceae archaeon]|nr:AMP-binding protein [Methanobacteriaceae archaeon]
MTLLLNKFVKNSTFDSYKDFNENFKIDVPKNFNFAYDVVDEYAKIKPEKIALVWCNDITEKIFTFEDLKFYTDKAANFFKSLGIKKSDKVMLTLKSRYDFWISIIALHKIGAIVIPATHMLKPEDIVYRLQAGDIKAVITIREDEVPENFQKAEKESGKEIIKIFAGEEDLHGWYNLREEIQKASKDFVRPTGSEATKETDTAVIFFSSGTTGLPKMVKHDYRYPLGHIVTAKYWQNVVEDGLHYTIADTGWGKALWGEIYGQWISGSAVFVYDYDRFHAEQVLNHCLKHNITTLCCPPTMYRLFIKENIKKFDFSSIQQVVTAGEPLNDEVFRKFKEVTGLEIKQGFGQTESVVSIATFFWMDIKLGSMGKPAPIYDVMLMNHEGNECDIGEEGEIVINVSEGIPVGLFTGYYNDPEKTNEAYRGGYYHTGDTAWKDEEGYYWFKGRVDDVIKSSGYKIGPFEVESALLEHDAVFDCAITGIPHQIRGQIVKATIVLSKGYTPSDELTKELQNHVKQVTAPYKYPRAIEYVEKLPKTFSGKLMRKKIRLEDEEKLKSKK